MSSSVRVSTSTYAVTYVANKMVIGLKRLVVGCGLDASAIVSSWGAIEQAIDTWLKSRHLTAVVLEVWDTTRTGHPLVGRFDFDIDYGYYADGDGELWMDTSYVNGVIRKNGSFPRNCTYRVVCSVSSGAPDIQGWGNTELRSTSGLRRHSIGTTIGGGGIGAGLTYWKAAS